jgi:cytochrome c oxidase subunit IV
MRTGFIYAHQWRPDTGFNWRSRRRTGLVLWQLVPWVAIALYVVIVPEQAKVVAASSESGLCFPALDDLVRNPPGASRWSLIPVAMMAAMAAGLVVSIALDWHRESAKLRGTIVSSILLLMLAAAAASFRVDTIVWFYRLIGPLAALTFGLMFLPDFRHCCWSC